jgi:hypothetical protein
VNPPVLNSYFVLIMNSSPDFPSGLANKYVNAGSILTYVLPIPTDPENNIPIVISAYTMPAIATLSADTLSVIISPSTSTCSTFLPIFIGGI